MGIIVNAATIIIGGLLGSIFKEKVALKNTAIFGICVMLISAVGLVENIFSVSEGKLGAGHLYVVVVALAIGAFIGERLKIEQKLSTLAKGDKPYLNGFIDSTVFFAIGGLQICGSILLAIEGDSSQLYLKSVIDLPFSMMFGAIYGSSTMLSAVPVALVQILIATAAHFLGSFISDAMISQLNAIGYIILFFSGFNMICEPKYKIKNTNMIPAILLIILYNVVVGLFAQ